MGSKLAGARAALVGRARGALRAGLLAAAALAGLAAPAAAQIGSERYAAIVLDHRSGRVLVDHAADETRHPASLTKMMTLYMVFEALRDGRLSLDSRVPMSEEAASRPPSKLGVPAGHSITVEQAILALVTRSANDVAAAVGERLGGSEARFAQMMTLRARNLGMTRTTFRNASGLPDADQVTTARDMATLGRRLFTDFPDRYHYFGVAHAQFGGMRIRNHNRMLETYEGVDGIKTGFIRDSGFNIVTSASRGGQRLIGAVFGGSSWVERDAQMASLLDTSFAQLGIGARDDRTPGLLRTAEAAALPVARGAARTPPREAPRLAQARSPVRTAAAATPARAGRAAPATGAPRRAGVQPVRAPSVKSPAARPAAAPAAARSRAGTPRPAPAAATPRSAARPTPTAATRAPAPLPAPVPRGSGTLRTAELR